MVHAQLTPQSRIAHGLKSMVLTGDARLVGMSVLPAGLSAPEASGSETDDDFAEEDAAQPEEPADSPVPSLLLVTQQVGTGLGALGIAFNKEHGGNLKGQEGVLKMCGRAAPSARNSTVWPFAVACARPCSTGCA